MTEYQVGSLGNLISGTSSPESGTRIVFEKVDPKPNPARVIKHNPDGRFGIKTKGMSTLREKGRRLKGKISEAILSKKKPEIAGDEDCGAVGKMWRHLPKSEETSEVDGKDTFSRNAARRVHIKNNTKKHVDDPEREARTIFVGNVPYAHAKKKKIIKFFSQFGEVESARFRCAPLKDPRMSKKVAIIKHEFHPERSSICAYVVFKTPEEAESAVKANGILFHDHHLRVDKAARASSKDVDPRQSIFIGNLAFSAEEEDLWELFSSCGTIKSIRIVRDPITAVSKGIAFVNFESADGAELALQLDQSVVRKRKIAVKRNRPSAKLATKKSQSEMLVRHKNSNESSGVSRATKTIKEEVRMEKKEKRRLRREGEKMLGIVKKKKNSVEDIKFEPKLNEPHIKKEVSSAVGFKKGKFQGQTVDDSKKKKKKVNKGELKKKKVAHVLGTSLQKKKKNKSS